MQRAVVRFTKNDLAKYPFLKETTDYVKTLDLKVEDLAGPGFSSVFERAEDRVEEAILYTVTGTRLRNAEVEILSFPTAILLVLATEDRLIKKRYALAEAKQANEEMRGEPKEKIMAIAKNFGWNLAQNNNVQIGCEFLLSFIDYVKNTTHLKDGKWKLVNRILTSGNVYLTRNEVTRLLSEEVRRHVEKRLEVKDLPAFPAIIRETAEKMKKLAIEKIGKTEMETLPQVTVQAAFPPCIEALYQTFTSGRHLSHVGRFTLTSFLINVGMPTEKVIELYRNFSDFNERMTRYQVEHIAGEKGSRTRYIPPKCDTLQTHGVCAGPNELCRRISHPLAYYRRKLTAG
ncbi:MAG TPA: DNA primase large subunit PriL [Candidatus Acidoferrum sp.]|nr:DNA primase large subunit PriL [Candidatus Acidoferrum sp.]